MTYILQCLFALIVLVSNGLTLLTLLTALLISMALGLFKERREHRGQRDHHADKEQRKPHRPPQRRIARRARLLRNVGVRDAKGDHRKDEERAGEDIKIATHRSSPILRRIEIGCRLIRDREELLDVGNLLGQPVRRQAFEEDAAVALALDARIEQHQNATIIERANQAAKALLQRDNGIGNLVVEKRFAA